MYIKVLKSIAFTSIITSVGLVSCQNNNSSKAELKEEIDSVSYSLGVNIAVTVKGQGLDSLNIDALARGMKDIYEANPDIQITKDEALKILQDYGKKSQLSQYESNKKAGEDFLAENKTKEGVITTASGLQYKVIKEGKGSKPTINDVVKTHYHGTTVDGKVFDSSVERGEPISFPVNGVIPGWTEALQLMPVGSKWQLYIPYQLAYGEQGAGGAISPFSALIFDVELLEIEKAKK